MLRSLLSAAILLPLAMATAPTVDVTRTAASGGDETTFTYTVTSGTMPTRFSLNTEGCTFTSAFLSSTDAMIAGDSITFTNPTRDNVFELVLSSNIPAGQTKITGVLDDTEFSLFADGPNCGALIPAPACVVNTQSIDTVTCADNVATVSLSTPTSASTYLWSSTSGDVTIADASAPSTVATFAVSSCTHEHPIKLTVTSVGGSSSECTGTIAYHYQGHLAFESVPDNIAVACGDVPASADLVASGRDTCFDVTQTVADVESAKTSDCSYTLTRTWTLTDDCVDDATIVAQVISVSDSVAPVISGVPADITASCDNVPPPCEANAWDEGDNTAPLVSFSETRSDGSCPSEYMLFRTWTAEDASGNPTTAKQTITVTDTQNPVLIGLPDDVAVQCDAVPVAATVTGHDNCDRSVTVSTSEASFANGVIRTFTTADLCGNTVEGVQTVTIGDSVPPVLSGVEGHKTVECSNVPSSPCEVTAKDKCEGTVTVTHSQAILPGSCPEEYTIVNTWNASDSNDNPVSADQTITVQDTAAPEITGTLSSGPMTCKHVIPDAAVAYDLCDEDVSVETSDVFENEVCTNTVDLVRSYQATDDCGNTASAAATLTFTDTKGPYLENTPMAVVTVQCSAVPAPNSVLANDNCFDGTGTSTAVTVDYTSTTLPGSCTHEYTEVRTWTASDVCGNPTTFVQTLNVIDTDDPVISPPMDSWQATASSQCEDVEAMPTISATDSCASVTEDFTEYTTAGACTSAYTITREWSFSDDCGNTASRSQVVTVGDTEDPVLVGDLPVDTTAECDDIPDAHVITATDNCDVDPVEFTEVTAAGRCTHEYALIRSWSVEDSCGQTDSHVQTVSVYDSFEPTIDGCTSGHMGDLELHFDEDFPTPPVYTASDACDSPTVTFQEVRNGTVCAETLYYIWTSTDTCGRKAATCVHTYNIVDSIDPTITAPEDQYEPCDFPHGDHTDIQDYITDKGLVPTYNDTRGTGLTQNGADCSIEPSCTNAALHICDFVVSDACGNTATDTMTVTVKDVSAPYFTAPPADMIYECVETDSIPVVLASDVCQGVDSITAVHTSEDLTSFTETDAGCVLEQRVDTWTAVDDCGNEASTWRTVSIRDTTPPVLTCPDPVDVQCSYDAPTELSMVPGQSDNCQTAWGAAELTQTTATNEEDILGSGTNCGGDYTRTYTLTDNCGQTDTCSYDWHIEDDTPPTCTPLTDDTVECGSDNPIPNLTCNDNCDAAPSQIPLQQEVAYETCNDQIEGDIFRLWTVSDECGNEQEYVQTLEIQDTTDPTFDTAFTTVTGLDVTSACSYTDALPEPVGSDICFSTASVGLVSSKTTAEIAAACAPDSWTHTWTVTDDCGNSDDFTQTVQITGNETLVWDDTVQAVDSSETVEWYDGIPTNFFDTDVTASSDCDNVNATCELTKEPGTCDNEWTWINTCTASNSCADTISFTQTMIVEDTTPPEVPTADSGTKDCADGYPAAQTNCEDDKTNDCATCGDSCYEVIRTCTVADQCGNPATNVGTIVVQDIEAPTLTIPADRTSDCEDGAYDTLENDAAQNASVTDQCDASPGFVQATNVPIVNTDKTDTIVKDILRSWTATDACGNSVTKTQTVTFTDTTPPALCTDYSDQTAEADGTAFYGATYPRPATTVNGDNDKFWTCPSGAVGDDCSGVDFVTSGVTTEAGSCPQNFYVIFTHGATDNEGNTDTRSSTVEVRDTTPPVFSPAVDNPEVEADSIPAFDYQGVTASDVSGSAVTIETTEERIDSTNKNNFKLVRQWTATDECGNTAGRVQTITVVDTTPPVIIGTPGDTTVLCDDVTTIDHSAVEAEINHWADEGTVIVPTYTRLTHGAKGCTQQFAIEYKWEATDITGHTDVDQYTVFVEDLHEPTWDNTASDDSEEGCSHSVAPVLTATDNCATGLTTPGSDSVPYFCEDEDDACAEYSSGAVTVDYTESFDTVGSNGCSDYDVIRHWTTADECGQGPADQHQTIEIRDTTDPTFVEDTTETVVTVVNTCNTPTTRTMTCTDTCNTCTVATPTVQRWAGTTSCAKDSIEHLYTATDACGNELDWSYIVHFTDTKKPVLSQPQTVTVDMCVAVPAPPTVTCTDECDESNGGLSTCQVDGPDLDPVSDLLVLRTWTATDACGNSDTVVQSVIREDTSPPALTVPDDYEIDCSEAVVLDDATVSDDCDTFHGDTLTADIAYTAETVQGSCLNEYKIIRSWSITDGYNTVSDTQTITIIDDGVPVMDDAPADITYYSDGTGGSSCPESTMACSVCAAETISWGDCGTGEDKSTSGTVTATIAAPIFISTDGHSSYKEVRTYVATDECGQTTSDVQTATFLDNTPPEWVATAALCDTQTIPCESPDTWNGAPAVPSCDIIATDNCDASIQTRVAYTSSLGQDGCNKYEYRQWDVTDDSGNAAPTTQQTITIEDNTPPIFYESDSNYTPGIAQPPVAETYECDVYPGPPTVIADDNCDGSVTVSETTTMSNSDAPLKYDEVYITTYTAADDCGNSATISLTVTVEDTTDPSFALIADEPTQDCRTPEYRISDPTPTDNCEPVSLTQSWAEISTCPTTHAYSWTATDGAGNTFSDVATVVFPDVDSPVFTHADNFEDIEINATTSSCVLPAVVEPTATDHCDGARTVSPASTTPLPNGRGAWSGHDGDKIYEQVEYSWSVSDSCGQVNTATQTATLYDYVKPVMSCTNCDDDTIEMCNSNPVAPVVTGEDNCKGTLPNTFINSESTSEGADKDCLETITWTYCVYDDNGNEDCGSHVITVVDTSEPVFQNVPDAVTVSCSTASTHNYPDLSATNCNTNLNASATKETLPGSCPDEYAVVATWTTTDECALVETVTQTVTFIDDSPPVLSHDASEITAECDAVAPPQTPTASDDCDGNVYITHTVDKVPLSCTGSYLNVHTWVATDNCGLSDSGERTVVVQDTTPPVMSTICADDTIECTETVAPCVRNATDNCDLSLGTIEVTEETLPGSCTYKYEIVRSFTISDDCGNPVSDEQTITVEDTTPPTISGPADVTAEVPAIPFVFEGDHTGADACSNTTLECTEISVAGTCNHNYELVRTCDAIDVCGLSTAHTYTVTVEDTTPPTLFGTPNDVTVEWDSVPAMADALALVRGTDNSDSELTLDATEVELSRDNAHAYVLERTFSASDDCGNTNSVSTTVTVEDTTPPTLSEQPADETVDCDSVPIACTLIAVGEPSLTVGYTESDLADPERKVRTWDITDEADNTVSYSQTITIVDNAAPILSRTPADETVSCSCESFPTAPSVIGLDNCDENINVTYTETRTDGASDDVYSLTRTWDATDAAGNNVNHVQIITVEDTEAPTFYPDPSTLDEDVSCALVPEAAAVNVLDNCDSGASVTHTAVNIDTVCDNTYKIVRTYTSTDRTGNSYTSAMTVGVSDTTAPAIEALDDGCVMEGGASGSLSFTFAELFSTQDECAGTPTLALAYCNTTSTTDITCTEGSQEVSLTGTMVAGITFSVAVEATDVCGNSNSGIALIEIHDEPSAGAAGAENCKSNP